MLSRVIPDTWRTRTALVAPGVTALCILVAALLPGGLIAHPLPALALWLLTVAAWLVGAHWAGAQHARVILVLVLSLRVLGLLVSPSLSDDLFRYVHEGRASRLGLAVPFTTPPAELTPPPDDGTTARVNHPEVPAVYPPLSQLFLYGSVLVGDAVGAPSALLRLALALCDALVVLLLFARRRARPRGFLLYGLHPLPLLEGVIGSHLDILGVALITAAILALRRPLARGAVLGLAMGVKPIAFLGALAMPLERRALALVIAGALMGALVPALPYLVVGAPLTRGLVEYGTRWEAQPTLYALVEASVAAPFARRHEAGRYTHAHLSVAPLGLLVETAGEPVLALGGAEQVTRPLLVDERLVARLLCAALLALVLALLVARVRALPLRAGLGFLALWLLTPTMHPWYLLWLLPFAALSSSFALLLWAAAAPLAYQAAMTAHATGEWREALWPRVIMLSLLGLGAVVDVVRARAAGRGPSRDRAP